MATNIEAIMTKDESALEGGGGGGGGGVEEVTLKKGPWTAAEDAVLIEYVTKHGEGNWNAVQRNTGLARCGKSCRLRWANHLRPNLKKGAFSPQEEKLILELHAQYGNKWARMAALLPGRTDNEIKNYWNTRVKRRRRQGLPLYSDDQDRPTTSSAPITPTGQTHHSSSSSSIQFDFLHQHHHPFSSPHSPLSSPLQPHNNPNIPMSSSSSSSSTSPSPMSFIFNRPAPLLCNPLGFKRFRTHNGYSLPPSPTIPISSSLSDQPLTMPSLRGYSSGFGFSGQINPNSPHVYQGSLNLNQFSNISNTKLELPSNQFSQQVLDSEIRFDNNMQMTDNNLGLKTNDNGGFLGDFVFDSHQSQSLASTQTMSKKRSCFSLNEGNDDMFDGCRGFDDSALTSTYWSSTAGLKLKEEVPDHLSKSMSDDLSSFLSVTPPPSTMAITDWHINNHNNNAVEVSNNVQASSSVIPDDNFGLEMKPMASLFPMTTTTTTNHNDNSGYYTWDNLPGLC